MFADDAKLPILVSPKAYNSISIWKRRQTNTNTEYTKQGRTALTVLTVMAMTESLELMTEEQGATETKHPQY